MWDFKIALTILFSFNFFFSSSFGVFVFTGLDYWTGLLDWTTGLTLELTFELFFLLLMINIRDIAVVLLAKVNLGVLGK